MLYNEWLGSQHIKEVIFQPRFGKRSSAVVISSCPKCKRLSWEHFGLDGLLRYADQLSTLDKKAILNEICRRVRGNKKTWDNGTCHDCKYLKFAGYDLVDFMISVKCVKGHSAFDGNYKHYPSGELCHDKLSGPENEIDQKWYERNGIYLDPPVFVGDVEHMMWKYEKAFDKPWEVE